MSEPNSKRRRVFQLSTSERQGQLTSLPGFNAAMKAGRVGEYKLQGVLEEIEPLKGSWLYKQKQDGTHAIKLVVTIVDSDGTKADLLSFRTPSTTLREGLTGDQLHRMIESGEHDEIQNHFEHKVQWGELFEFKVNAKLNDGATEAEGIILSAKRI
jgi:hypothetical protein